MTPPCPTCGEPAKRYCRCQLMHSYCESGHEWHLCPTCREVVAGPADHRHPARCSCGRLDPQATAHPAFGPE